MESFSLYKSFTGFNEKKELANRTLKYFYDNLLDATNQTQSGLRYRVDYKKLIPKLILKNPYLLEFSLLQFDYQAEAIFLNSQMAILRISANCFSEPGIIKRCSLVDFELLRNDKLKPIITEGLQNRLESFGLNSLYFGEVENALEVFERWIILFLEAYLFFGYELAPTILE